MVVDRVNAYIQQRKDEDKNLVDLSTNEKEGERYNKCKTSLQQMHDRGGDARAGLVVSRSMSTDISYLSSP